ncbi:mediator of RNA polymerase II transcription subunit 15-like [Aristolochia californica]|uniref:mediator of RNA polymerase II transcription subunit 15-like n=1 Tax=Aristolochia californica TaxID=171875 RepID=UPI0035D98428
MDYSAGAETQQQQLFQQQQQQEQQQQQYDPSQVQPQSFDHATQAYYPYYPNSHHQYAPLPYPYYQPDYSNPSTAHNAYQQQRPPAENLQPPGISAPSDSAPQSAGAAHQNAYYPPEHGAYPVVHGLNPAAAAAVAALSELQHNMDAAERAERAERAMAAGMLERHRWPPRNGGYPPMPGPPPSYHHGGPFRSPVGRPPYRGSGRRGGGPYRGGGRNNYGHHPYKSDSFKGKGRMARGAGGRRFHPSGSAAPHPDPGPEPATAASEEGPGAQPQVPAALSQPMPQVSWCELCMVDCNSLEILEQHLNGKRHKKNVQRLQEFEKHKKMMAELQQKSGVPPQQEQTQPQTEVHPHEPEFHQQQSETQPERLSEAQPELLSEAQPEQQTETQHEHEQQAQSQQQESQPQLQSESESLPEKVQSAADEQESKQTSAAPETLPHPTSGETAKMEEKQQNQAGEQPIAEVSTAPSRRPTRGRGHWDDRRRVPKQERMVRFVRGAKRMRMSERMMDGQFPREPKEPKEEPKFCSLCNVTCDTQAVFECHLAGKKHNSRMKRTQGSFGGHGVQSFFASHTQPAGYVPRGYNQPIVYSHPGQEMSRQQPIETESAKEATSDSHGEKKFEPFKGQEVIVGSGSQEAPKIQPEGQSSQHSSIVESNGQISVSEPKEVMEVSPLDSGVPPVVKAAEIRLNSEGQGQS